MSLTAFGPVFLPDVPGLTSGAPTFTSFTIDAAAEKVAAIIPGGVFGQAIRKILWRTGTVTTGDTVDVRVETVDNTTGNPTGTLVNANANASQVVANGDDDTMFTTTLTADADVSALDYFAVVIVNGGGGGNMQISIYGDDANTLPYTDHFTASWTKNSLAPVVGFELADGSYIYVPGCWPIQTITTSTFNNGSTPDVYANRITIATPCKVSGFWTWFNNASVSDCAVKLYDTDGVTVLASTTLDATNTISTNIITVRRFASEITLAAGNYWLGLEPTSTNNVSVYDFTVPSAAALASFQGGASMQFSTAKNPSGTGSWTTTATRRLYLGLLFSAFDDGAGGGGGVSVLGASFGDPHMVRSYR
jgi:hypothetical protein